ncbi:MAG: ABC transporter ATP-binding protein [Blastochloris sp.]|nr:ABC transporter ATP-binding protein [Blastochloris sp.]
MNEPVIETRELTKFYGDIPVVNMLNIQIPRGMIYGFLGRNGAGKTTTIRMLMGLVEPTRGEAKILGQDRGEWTPELRARVGYLAEGHHVYGWMTVRECGLFQAAFYQHWNADIFHAVIKHFGLNEKAKAGGLSRGQRAGLCLALTLAPEPELLVLDDPALGLDPVARRSLLESMIYVTRKQDRSILFSSHLLSDVERVADRIGVMDRGVLRADCTMEEFRRHIHHFVLEFAGVPPAPPQDFEGCLLASFRTEEEMSLTLVNPTERDRETMARLKPRVCEERDLDLEEAFIRYVGDRGEKSFLLHEMGEKK